MDAKALHNRDQQKRKRGWVDAFIAPVLPIARTKLQRRVRAILREHGVDVSSTVTLHIYDVVDMLEKALSERDD